MVFQGRVGGICLAPMSNFRDHLPGGWIDVGSNVLLYPDRNARRECAIDPICPLAIVRITIMRIQQRLSMIYLKEIVSGLKKFGELGRGRKGQPVF